MTTLENLVRSIRSKNAGPFWLTIDAFCESADDARRVAAAFERERAFIAAAYHVRPEDLQIYCLEHIQVTKLSLPRVPPEGSRDERDMHGGQQYVTLLDLPC